MEEQNQNIDTVRVLMATKENLISGDLSLPTSAVVENPTIENLLFYALNCGNKFVALRDCTIMDYDNTEFEPEKVDFFVVNLDIVQTCRIVKK